MVVFSSWCGPCLTATVPRCPCGSRTRSPPASRCERSGISSHLLLSDNGKSNRSHQRGANPAPRRAERGSSAAGGGAVGAARRSRLSAPAEAERPELRPARCGRFAEANERFSLEAARREDGRRSGACRAGAAEGTPRRRAEGTRRRGRPGGSVPIASGEVRRGRGGGTFLSPPFGGVCPRSRPRTPLSSARIDCRDGTGRGGAAERRSVPLRCVPAAGMGARR